MKWPVLRGLSGFKRGIRDLCKLVLVVPDARYAGTVEISKKLFNVFRFFYSRLYISGPTIFRRENGIERVYSLWELLHGEGCYRRLE